MTRILSILLLSIFLFQNFTKVFILANYQLNKEYIAANLCENKNKPQLNCEGHCQLKKQLEKDEKQQQSPVNPIKEKNEVQLCADKKSSFSFFPSLILTETAPFENSYISGKHLLSVFHPPTA